MLQLFGTKLGIRHELQCRRISSTSVNKFCFGHADIIAAGFKVASIQGYHCCFFFTGSVFFCFTWGSRFFIENLGFFDCGQILEMYVVFLYFPFKKTK